ncbi:amino acid ABC transporter ATP-binding protein, PAAT family [Agrococcus baldri]|uniref:ABC-type polar-amino-acid transporter n=1 Tax=Agrococcus baldri TaxID=153730 RepID=A0AA94KZR9_9MICO|nr:amino acid ABC transporter ATP-binding protein [Agrococcus baldri]SFS11819.1 amino acid ABC transporter ATP-binding protein, PAAT family [Agrococcus baldri]
MTAPLVEIMGVRKSYGDLDVLKGIDLEVQEGQVVCLIGPSGGGKSTLLRCVNHLERVDQGAIKVAGEVVGYRWQNNSLHEMRSSQVCKQRAKIGMVFQQFNLFAHKTVLQNVTMGPIKLLGLSKDEAIERARTLLDHVGLLDKQSAYPSQLSGGQSQRVAIARALAMEPRLMLFDEPTSALDPELVGDVLSVMRDLVSQGMTMLVVTHEMGFARDAADSVAFMAGGEIVEHGTPEQVLGNPQRERTRSFLSRVSA